MDRLLPDEFPFNKRRAAREAETGATAAAAPAATVASPAPATPAVQGAGAAAAPTAAATGASNMLALVPRAPVSSDLPVVAPYRGPERRRAIRLPMRVLSIYRGDINPAGAGPVQLINISMCGVRLWSARPLKVGERGTVKLDVGPVRWSTRVRVIACDSRDGEGFTVGCEFATCEGKRRVA
jgi:hypothetical protein